MKTNYPITLKETSLNTQAVADLAKSAEPLPAPTSSSLKSSPLTIRRILIFLLPFSLIWFQEFSERTRPHPIYSPWDIGFNISFRPIDGVVCAFVLLAILFSLVRGNSPLPPIPRSLLRWLILFGLAFLASNIYGVSQGATHVFAESRNIVLGCLFAIGIWSMLRTTPDFLASLLGVLLAIGLKSLFHLSLYVAGISDIRNLGVRIPIFDGAALTGQVFGALACIALAFGARWKGLTRAFVFAIGALSTSLVVLSFRRSFWAQLIVGAAIILFLQRRGRVRAILLVAAVVTVAYLQLGSALTLRLASSNPFTVDNPYASTNEDHVDDILDALDIIRSNPLLGFGPGRPYPTPRLSSWWKTESWGVHNAAIHVWLKYGLLGLFAYIGLHLSLLAWLYRTRGMLRPNSVERSALTATFAFHLAVFTISLTFAPWPYGALQTNIVMFGTLMIALFVRRKASEDVR